MPGEELGEYYTVPVILSMAGIEKQANKVISRQMGDIGQQSSQAFTKGFVSEARSSEQQIKRLSENYNKLYDKAADAAGKLKVAQAGVNDLSEKGITSGQRYERSIQAQEKATRDHARAIRTAKDAYKEYEDAAKRAGNASDGIAQGAVSGMRGAAGEAISAGRDAAGGFAEGFAGAAALARIGAAGGPIGIALAGAAAVGLGAGKLLADQIAIGMGQVATVDLFQSRLGIDDASMGNVARGAAKAYVDVFGQSVEDNLQTAQFAFQGGLIDSNATEAEAQRVISQIDTIRSVGEADAREITRAMNQLVRTGLASNFTEASDILVTGFQRGLDVSGDFLDSISEYSTQFRELGLTGADALGLIKQGLEGGARDTDIVADALKEFAIRAKDGSELTANAFTSLGLNAQETMAIFAAGGEPARQMFGEVLDRIREIPSAFDQALVTTALFGTQAEDVQDAFDHLNLDKATEAVGDFKGASDQAMATAADNAATEWEEAGRHIEDTFRNLRMKIADWFSFIPEYFNDLFTPGGINSPDAPPGPDPAGTGPLLLPSTTGSTPSGVPQLAPGLAIPGVTAAPTGAPFTVGGYSGGGGSMGPGGRPMPGTSLPLGNLPLNTGAGLPRKVGSDSGLLPQTIAVKDQIATQFGDITDIGGWRPPDGYNEHSSGRAIDVMIPNWNTPQGKAYGDQVVASALKNPNVNYVLWQQTQWNSDGTSKPMSDRGSPTQNHFDHAHIYTYADTGQHPTGTPPVSTGPGGTSGLGPGPVSPAVHNAFGASYEPGMGTPGYNEFGEPGYYETDPRRIAQAQRSAEDSSRRIEDADQRIIDADKAVVDAAAERDRIAKMSEIERTMNKVDLGKADADLKRARDQAEDARLDAGRAREDAQWAQQDVEEAKQGTFRPAREAKKPPKAASRGGTSELGEIGSIAGSFLKETFGIGSWLPDLADLWPVQAADAIMSTAVPMLSAYANGEWQPGGLLGDALGTSSAPFGMPDVTAPPMPAPGQHPGSGALPGPGGNTTVIDQSIHGGVNGSIQDVMKTRDDGLRRVLPRIKPGA
jgi:hypothetical protein